MSSKRKKTVSLEYKNKLLAEIEYYEKRISETQQRNNSKSSTHLNDLGSSDEDDSNPYTLNVKPSIRELKRQEASLESRLSMTLELAMLTLMNCNNTIMTEPPVVRHPINEPGTWLEVTADCKIDLVPFGITFNTHKPHRKNAPTHYRNVQVKLSKAAHEKELSRSILPKLDRPSLALQVLQSYASACRSRRSTLLDLAQKYGDQIRMEAMAEGGYRVKFLDLLSVGWSLENFWSPAVPFFHRMKFEIEYMPKEYVHIISRLYKQFKDPSLETSERTLTLCQIFDTCLDAQGAARELQESAESDPDTSGCLYERRTTIDEEPEIPSSYHLSKKTSKGKENKAHNRKTAMEPPKTLPKKVKKTRPHSQVSEDINAKKSKLNNTDVTNDSRVVKKANDKNASDRVDVAKKNKANDKEGTVESRRGVKRGIESGTLSNAKKIRSENEVENEKTTEDKNDTENVKNKATGAKNSKDANKKGDLKSASTNSLRNKVANDEGVAENGTKIKVTNSMGKADDNIESVKVVKKSEKEVAKGAEYAGLKKTSNKKDKTETNNAANPVKNNTKVDKEPKSSNNVKNKIDSKEGDPKKKTDQVNSKVAAKNKNVLAENVQKNVNKVVTRKSNILDKATENKTPQASEAENITKKGNDAKTVANSKNADNRPKNSKQAEEKEPNAVKSNVNTVKNVENKNDTGAKKKADSISSNANNEAPKQNIVKDTKNKVGTLTKTADKALTKSNDQNKQPIQNALKNKLNAKSVGSTSNKENVTKSNIKELLTKKQSTQSAPNVNKEKNKKMTEISGSKDNNSNLKEKKDEAGTSNTQNNLKTTEIDSKNTISNNNKESLRKFAETQSKIAAKLKSRIPMMKSNIKISTLTSKMEKNTVKSAEKITKIPLKSQPVFKKINIPVRMSPRKLPPSFKPPKGVSNKQL